MSQDAIKHRDKNKTKPLLFAIPFVIIIGIIIMAIITHR
jgi:hypothetical protein